MNHNNYPVVDEYEDYPHQTDPEGVQRILAEYAVTETIEVTSVTES